MPDYLLDAGLLPEPLWNSQLACLQSIVRAAGLPFDLVETAGCSGLALRSRLCRNAMPASQYYSWPWQQDFAAWTAALGLDCEIACCPAGSPLLPRWAARQRQRIEQSLANGWPAVIWNGMSFSVICGTRADECIVSMPAAQSINPEAEAEGALADLLKESRRLEGQAAGIACGWDILFAQPGEDSFVLTLCGQLELPQLKLDESGLLNCWLELCGRSEYQRQRVGSGSDMEVLAGTAALRRLSEELRDGRAQAFGMHQAVHSLVELRRQSAAYLRRLSLRLPDCAERLEQCAQFCEQELAQLRRMQAIYSAPDVVLRQAQQQQARQALWEALRLEETVQRLLGSVVQDVFEISG
jgi:hypothetical protein